MFAVTLIVHLGLLATGLVFFIKYLYEHGLGILPVLASLFGFAASAAAVYYTIEANAGTKVSAWGFFFTVNFGKYFLLFTALAVVGLVLTLTMKHKFISAVTPGLFFAAGGIPLVWFSLAGAWIKYFEIIQRY